MGIEQQSLMSAFLLTNPSILTPLYMVLMLYDNMMLLRVIIDTVTLCQVQIHMVNFKEIKHMTNEFFLLYALAALLVDQLASYNE